MNIMGADVVFNHADYRLVSARVLKEFSNFKEVNLFLRGMFPLVGFKSTCVYYERNDYIVYGRYTINRAGCYRRVCWKNIHGSKAQTKIYYKCEYLYNEQ